MVMTTTEIILEFLLDAASSISLDGEAKTATVIEDGWFETLAGEISAITGVKYDAVLEILQDASQPLYPKWEMRHIIGIKEDLFDKIIKEVLA